MKTTSDSKEQLCESKRSMILFSDVLSEIFTGEYQNSSNPERSPSILPDEAERNRDMIDTSLIDDDDIEPIFDPKPIPRSKFD